MTVVYTTVFFVFGGRACVCDSSMSEVEQITYDASCALDVIGNYRRAARACDTVDDDVR